MRGVSRRYRVVHERNLTLKETLLRRRRTVASELWVLRGVDLDVARGEALGIVGRNGIGKSTLLKLVAGVIPPQTGSVEVGGVVAPLLELGAGFHPDFTGRENVFMQGALYGLTDREMEERLDAIVDFAELSDFIDMPVKTYSTGMFMRLGFAIAAHVDPDVLLLDEILGVGDVAFQRKCFARIFQHREAGGTILFVSHSQGDVERVCDRAILLDGGGVVAEGSPSEVFASYNRLMSTVPARTTSVTDVDDTVAQATSWGTGRVVISAFRILGATGPCDTFASGDELRLEMDVIPTEPIEMPVFGVNFYLPDHTHLYGTNNRLDGADVPRLDGPTTVTYVIPSLPFHAGSFVVSLTACSYDESEIFHHLNFCAEVDVYQRSPGVGPVRLDASWEVEPLRAAGSAKAR